MEFILLSLFLDYLSSIHPSNPLAVIVENHQIGHNEALNTLIVELKMPQMSVNIPTHHLCMTKLKHTNNFY